MKKIKTIVLLALISAAFLTGCAKEATGTPVFKAGTYTAEAEGYGGPVTVEVKFTDSKIESVKVLTHGETAGISDKALTDVPAKILEAQSLDVDVSAGATFSSRAIKYAVADCVKQAGGEDHVLMDVDLAKPSESEKYFAAAVASVEKPVAVDGVIEVTSYDDLKKSLGYYDFIVNPDTKEGKFMYVPGSAEEGHTIKLMSDLTAEGDKDNPNFTDAKDKEDVITGATVLVTKNVTIDGNGKKINGNGYGTFVFSGKDEDFGNEGIEATMKNITIDGAVYNAKIGGAIYVVGDATLNLEDSTLSNNKAGSAKLLFNGGGAIYLNSHGLAPEVGRAVLVAKNSTFTGNTTANGGGAALMALNGDIHVISSKLNGNKSLSEMGVGGAIALRGDSNLLVENSEITGNEATVAGGGIYIFDGESLFKGDGILTSANNNAVLKNTTVSGNKAAYGIDVTYGRFYSDTYEGDRERNGLDLSEGNTVGDYQDLIFTSIERTELKK